MHFDEDEEQSFTAINDPKEMGIEDLDEIADILGVEPNTGRTNGVALLGKSGSTYDLVKILKAHLCFLADTLEK